MKKTTRLLRELFSVTAGRIAVPQECLLNDIVPFLSLAVSTKLKDGQVEEAIAVLADFKLTIDHFKEHLLELNDKCKGALRFNMLDTQTKSAFTRVYHKLHPDIVVKKKKTTAAGNAHTF